ncbi:hypothetical protein RI054_39g143750 [Pseudoscourfieldia marina]
MTSGYHPQPDAAESVNRLALKVLRSLLPALANRWDEMIDLVEFALNNAVCSTTGCSAFMLGYGHHPRSPLGEWHDADEQPPDQGYPVLIYMEKYGKIRLKYVRYGDTVPYWTVPYWVALLRIPPRSLSSSPSRRLSRQLAATQPTLLRLASRRGIHRILQRPTYKEGDRVWLTRPRSTSQDGSTPAGPYKIAEVRSPTTFRLELPANWARIPCGTVSTCAPPVSFARPRTILLSSTRRYA